MLIASNPVRSSADRYWRNCWLDTKRQQAGSSNKDLCVVYTELLEHYQRMADRYDGRSQNDT